MDVYTVTYRDSGSTSDGVAWVEAESRYDACMALIDQAEYVGVARRIVDVFAESV
jgi:hypothetical protein